MPSDSELSYFNKGHLGDLIEIADEHPNCPLVKRLLHRQLRKMKKDDISAVRQDWEDYKEQARNS